MEPGSEGLEEVQKEGLGKRKYMSQVGESKPGAFVCP